jgi:hypothetical protein
MPSVRPSVRILVAAGTIALSAVSLPPAHAETAPICPLESSQVIAEFDTPEGHHTRIAYFSPTPTEYDICIQALGDVQTVVAVTSDVEFAPPTATRSKDPKDCPHRVVHIDNPVVDLSAGVTVEGRAICFGMDDATTTITVGAPSHGAVPSAVIWLPANSFVNQWGWCGKYYAAYETHKAGHEAWRQCYQQDNRVG